LEVKPLASLPLSLRIVVTGPDTAANSLRFDSPATGTLDDVLLCAYDRSDETPAGLWTPTDIHREVTER